MNAQTKQEEKIERNVQRTVAKAVLRQISQIVDEEQEAEARRAKMLRMVLRYGWTTLLPALWLMAYYLGIV